jgi:uncharacterized protein YceK
MNDKLLLVGFLVGSAAMSGCSTLYKVSDEKIKERTALALGARKKSSDRKLVVLRMSQPVRLLLLNSIKLPFFRNCKAVPGRVSV